MVSEILFKTKYGLISAKKAAQDDYKLFLAHTYFSEDVLRKYEDNKNYTVGYNGTISCGNKWGLVRGIYRVKSGILVANLGDIGQSLPLSELKWWQKYNVSPPKNIDRYYSDFRDEIKRILSFLNHINVKTELNLKNNLNFNSNGQKLFLIDNIDEELKVLRKSITKHTHTSELLFKVIILNNIILDKLNTELIKSVFIETKNEDWMYQFSILTIKENCHKCPKALKQALKSTIHPLDNYNLLFRFLLFLNLNYDIQKIKKINTNKNQKRLRESINKQLKKQFRIWYKYQGNNQIEFKNQKYIKINEDKIKNILNFIYQLRRLRNSSAAHGFNKIKFLKLLNEFGINYNSKHRNYDSLKIYTAILKKLNFAIEQIFFYIPVKISKKEDSKQDLEMALAKLKNTTDYKSIFEDLLSIIGEYPKLEVNLKIKLKEISKIKSDKKYFLELGYFIESLSYYIGDKSQYYINLIFEHKFEDKRLFLAHVLHIVNKSKIYSKSFMKKIKPVIYAGLLNENTDISFLSQDIILNIIKKDSSLLDLNLIKNNVGNKKIYFKELKNYIGA